MIAWLTWLTAFAWAWLLVCRGGFWRIDHGPLASPPLRWPVVTAVIPARDEAAVIGRALGSVLDQDYPGPLAVIVADDASQDDTAAVAAATAAASRRAERFAVIPAGPLPEGWSGKMWAQSRAIEEAVRRFPETELLLLTDADIAHDSGELARMVAHLEADRLDMASLMVRLSCTSLAERCIVPAFVFFFRMLYPFAWVADPGQATAAAAGGYILIRRRSLEKVGGLAAIRHALIDDCSLAGLIKGHGGCLSLHLAGKTVSLRHYPTADGLWAMIARTAYTQLRHSPLLLAGTVLAMTVGFLLPPLVLIGGWGPRLPAAVAWLEMSAAYAPMLAFYGLSRFAAPLLPAVAAFYLAATVESARRYRSGRGGGWKGRAQAAGTTSAAP